MPATYAASKYATCISCGANKPIHQMRHPLSSRGKTPSTCHECRTERPDEGWCDDHQEWHPRSSFSPVDRPIGIGNNCIDAMSRMASEKRAHPQIHCPSCNQWRDSWYFRGGRAKSRACRSCEDAHIGKRWCVECMTWLDETRFNRTGLDGRFWTVRCKQCRVGYQHGVSWDHLMTLCGGDPRCAACGSDKDLKVDHDHRHCPASRGCKECVRGFLCHGCNTAEGLLQVASRARLLADYMDRWGLH